MRATLTKSWGGSPSGQRISSNREDCAEEPGLRFIDPRRLQYLVEHDFATTSNLEAGFTQIPGIGAKSAKALSEAGYSSLDDVAAAEPEELEALLAPKAAAAVASWKDGL